MFSNELRHMGMIASYTCYKCACVLKWHTRYSEECENVEDDEHPGQPCT